MYQQGYHAPYQAPAPRQTRPQSSRKRKKHPFLRLVFILCLIALTVFGAYYLKVYLEVKPYESVYLDNIYVDGISLGGLTPDEAARQVIEHIQQRQQSWSLALKYGDHTYYTLTYDTMGIHTDTAQALSTLQQALQLGHTGSTFDRKRDLDALRQNPYKAYTIQSEMTDQQLDSILSQIAQDMYRAPSDAYLVSFNPDADDPFTIQNETYGQQLNTQQVKEQVLEYVANGTSGSLSLIPDVLSPSVTAKDVRGTVTLLGTGITPVSKTSEENRTNNIRVAFSRYNGLVIENGKRVSFNSIVGERTAANGFYTAEEYVSGDLVTGIGGGVCQASSTIYIAALTSNLKINDRKPHSDPVSYLTFGQDATVYWMGSRRIDFAFTNTSGGNLYITAHVEKLKNNTYQCVVRMYGLSLGEGVSYQLDTRTIETLTAPVNAEYVKDKNHEYVTYTDEEKLVRKARDGFVNETYLQRWENGNLVSETLVSRDTCQARAAKYYVGTVAR